jgi:hypothetical protein
MKKALLLLFVAAGMAISAGTTKQDSGTPAITFEKSVIDMGNIRKDSEAICEFKFTNTGNAPLVVQSVKGQCGCTTILSESWSKEPIAPGGTASFKVKYDTSTRVGMFDKKIMVQTNAAATPFEVKIKGNVLP